MEEIKTAHDGKVYTINDKRPPTSPTGCLQSLKGNTTLVPGGSTQRSFNFKCATFVTPTASVNYIC